jgi:hypothetical protein
VTMGGGFIGGGFFGDGLSAKGPIEGMVVASRLNSLTARTEINTVVRMATSTGELFSHNGHAAPEELRIKLSAVFAYSMLCVQPRLVFKSVRRQFTIGGAGRGSATSVQPLMELRWAQYTVGEVVIIWK